MRLPKLFSVLGGWRDLRKLRVAQERTAAAAERIADYLEGKTPFQELPEPPQEPLGFATTTSDHERIAHAWECEQQLRNLLGRDPDPEEIDHMVDGIEWGEDEVMTRLNKMATYAKTRPRVQ